jgi:hypothetical protein
VEDNRRVYEVIKDKVASILLNMTDVEVLAHYAADVRNRLNQNYLDNQITDLIKTGIGSGDDKEYQLAKRLFKAFAKESLNIEKVGVFADQFAIDYISKKEKLNPILF